mgnify:CR=1 FL=1
MYRALLLTSQRLTAPHMPHLEAQSSCHLISSHLIAITYHLIIHHLIILTGTWLADLTP